MREVRVGGELWGDMNRRGEMRGDVGRSHLLKDVFGHEPQHIAPGRTVSSSHAAAASRSHPPAAWPIVLLRAAIEGVRRRGKMCERA